MEIAFLVIAALILVAVGVQVRYAQSVLRAGVDVGYATKFVWGLNVGLLLVLLVVLGYFMLGGGS